MMYVHLSAAGNPDFGEYGDIGAPERWEPVVSYAAASAVVRAYIAEYDLGGGNWTGGEIRAGERGTPTQVVARVSYNGRVWPPDRWQPGTVPLYDPQ